VLYRCFCLAYEFCEGGSLLSLLSDSTRYYEYLPIALDVANGMAYLHSRNVIHRDLKPSNILLTRDNRAKIADFGMSVTHTGQELTAETGTYRYMAPEVIRHESYSSNADVYSFGICLWQLISREVPFATMTPIQAAYAVAEGRRPPMPESTPRQLCDIITACWDQDSHKRPSFTYIAMALADYAKMAFSPAAIGAQTLNIANEMLASVKGNSTVNVDFSAPVLMGAHLFSQETEASSIGLEI
jgi:serine/threonine protein kinase